MLGKAIAALRSFLVWLLAGLLLALGGFGFAWDRLETTRPWERHAARGANWSARNAANEPLLVELGGRGGLILPLGAVVQLADAETASFHFERLDLRLARSSEDSVVELRFRCDDAGAYVLRLAPPTSHGVALWFQPEAGAERSLASRQDVAFVPPMLSIFDASLEARNGRLLVRIDGALVLDVEDSRPRQGTLELRAASGPLRLTRLRAEGSTEGAPWSWTEDFDALPRVTIAEAFFEESRTPLLVTLLLAIGWALLLPPVAKDRGRWLRGVVLLLLPLAMLGCAQPFVEFEPPAWLLTLLAILGLGVATAAMTRSREADATSNRGAWLACAVVAVAVPYTAMTVGDRECRLFAIWFEQARAANESKTPSSFESKELRLLDAGNSIAVQGGAFRDLDLHATLNLDQRALLEIRLHGRGAEGVALIVSADPRVATRFVRETLDEFTSIGDGSVATRSNRESRLHLSIRGDRYLAKIDGVEVARATERLFPAGETRLLAPRATVRISDLTVTPIESVDEPVSLTVDRWNAIGRYGGVLAAFSLFTMLLGRRSLLDGLASCAFALIPLGIVLEDLDRHGASHDTAIACAIFASGYGLIAAARQASRSTPLRFHASCLLTLLLGGFAYAEARRSGWPPDPVRRNALSPIEWSGERIEEDLLDFEHPLLRRWNPYLVDHRFNSTSVALEKPRGVTRVITLGTSSTQGYGTTENWPDLLEGELQRLGKFGRRLELVNAAWKGSTGQRLVHFFENVLLRFHPDVVLLSLYYNDSVALSQFDETGYYAAISAPEARRGILDRLSEHFEASRAVPRFRALEAAFRKGDSDLSRTWSGLHAPLSSPPERFLATLRRFAELSKAAGVRLILVKEPIAGDRPRIWKDEFRAAMDQVGDEFGIVVADPTPAMNAAGGVRLFMDEVHPYGKGHLVTAIALVPIVLETIEDVRR